MHGDELDELLEPVEGLLGILEQPEVEAKSTLVAAAAALRASRTVKIVNEQDRVESDVLRGALKDPDRLLLSQDVERIFGMVSPEQGKLRAHQARDRAIPAGIDEKGVKTRCVARECPARLSRIQAKRFVRTSAGIGMLFHGRGSAGR